MQKHFWPIDWVVLIFYFVGTMGVGFYFYRRSRSREGFTAAGRSLPGWACGLSIFATYLSSISFLALPGKSFSGNWNPFVFSLSFLLQHGLLFGFSCPIIEKPVRSPLMRTWNTGSGPGPECMPVFFIF